LKGLAVPHVVYVLSASDADPFAEMAAISVASLRISNPQAEITLVTDQSFDRLTTPGRKYLEANIDKAKIVEFPGSASQIERSRYLKCHLRHLIDGPFLFLDIDTLVLAGLGAIDTTAMFQNLDLAAVANIEPDGLSHSCEVNEHFKIMGWPTAPRTYLNAGVFYLADTPAAHEFSNALIRSWEEYVHKVGKFNDQPAFNRAIIETNPRFFELPIDFNAQIVMNPSLALDAKIIHYFTGHFEERVDTIGHLLAKQLKHNGSFDEDTLAKAVASRNPWVRIDTVKKAISVRKPRYIVAAVGARSMFRRLSRLQVKDIRSDIFQTIKASRSVNSRD
jgi:hypothetical protein